MIFRISCENRKIGMQFVQAWHNRLCIIHSVSTSFAHWPELIYMEYGFSSPNIRCNLLHLTHNYLETFCFFFLRYEKLFPRNERARCQPVAILCSSSKLCRVKFIYKKTMPVICRIGWEKTHCVSIEYMAYILSPSAFAQNKRGAGHIRICWASTHIHNIIFGRIMILMGRRKYV